MRDRLIELIKSAADETARFFKIESEECLKKGELPQHKRTIYDIEADYLIENGVKLPPVQIGQELWDIHYNRPRKWEVVFLGYNGKEWFINIYWHKDRHNFKTMQITYPFIGKMWYFTKEEAEKALKGGEA